MNYQAIILGYGLLLSSLVLDHAIATCVDHGIYISVFDINHDANSGQGEIIIKSFSDDLTNALRAMNLSAEQAEFNMPADADPCDHKAALEEYLNIHFTMKINDQTIDWKFSECNIENDTHWITLAYKSDLKVSKVEITTDWMTELFGNQQNIIKVNSDSQKLNARLGSEKSNVELIFN